MSNIIYIHRSAAEFKSLKGVTIYAIIGNPKCAEYWKKVYQVVSLLIQNVCNRALLVISTSTTLFVALNKNCFIVFVKYFPKDASLSMALRHTESFLLYF